MRAVSGTCRSPYLSPSHKTLDALGGQRRCCGLPTKHGKPESKNEGKWGGAPHKTVVPVSLRNGELPKMKTELFWVRTCGGDTAMPVTH
ncbi:hypothetical protein VULLAG_LOCUS2576 [Vulpes lagopus]